MTPDPRPAAEQPPPTEAEELSPYEGGTLGAGIDWSDPNARIAPLYMTTGGVAGVVVVVLVFLLLATVPLWHTDFWVHLKYGEWVAANRRLPDREPLSPFTDKQSPMFDAQWLTQVGYHGLFRAGSAAAGGDGRRRFEGGVEAVRIAHLLAAVAAVGLFGIAYRRAADSVPWGVGGVVFLVFPILGILGPLQTQRPQTSALLFFAAVLCALSRPVLTRRAVVWVPAALVLWANAHGSFVVGLGLLGVVLVGRVTEVVRAGGWRAAAGDVAIRRLGVTFLLAVAAVAALNPYGPRLFLDVGRFGESANLKTMGEWQPLNFSEGKFHWGYMASLILVAVTQVASPRPFSPTQLLIVLTLGVWPLFQQRMFVWWCPLVPWVIAPHWVAAAPRLGVELPPNTPSFKKTMFAVVVAAVAAFVSSPTRHWLKAGGPRPVEQALHPATPYDVAAALKGEPPAEPDRVAALADAVRREHGGRFTGRVFASETQGEYLLWALPPEAPVMMFNHAQLFPADYWAECLGVKEAAPGWWEVLDRRRAAAVVVEAGLYPVLCDGVRRHPGWRVVVDEADRPAGLFVAVRKPAGGAP